MFYHGNLYLIWLIVVCSTDSDVVVVLCDIAGNNPEFVIWATANMKQVESNGSGPLLCSETSLEEMAAASATL